MEQTYEEDGGSMTCLMVGEGLKAQSHTSTYASENDRGTLDEIHIVVYDTTGALSGFSVDANGQRTTAVLETYANLSVNNNAKGPQGDSIFYPDVIYRQSEFVYWMDHNTGGTNWELT